ncbi:MAG: VWA domain-containing protein [Xanthobacteraceae bacterium]|nr:VWA domain-containing protein [Xanthobacteraceae bacterium]
MRLTLAYLALVTALVVPFSLQPARAAKPIVEVAFVLDTTGSMSGLIENAKRKIWSIATAIVDANPDAEVRMALVAYRDIGDEYVTKKFDLTVDIQGLYAELLKFRAQGGGDWPESVNEALDVAVTKLNWTQDSGVRKIVFLVGDAPPHMDYKQDRKYSEVVKDARARGIIVNAVQAGPARDTERFWREIAQLGDGKYIQIPQDGGVAVIIKTPYDREILELQIRLNRTVLPYGKRAQQENVRQRLDNVASAPVSTATDIAVYRNKSKNSGVVSADGDLVADVESGRVKLEAVPDAELPETLQKLPPAARKVEVEKQNAERKAIDEKLAQLVKERDAYVAAERKKNAPAAKKDSFDQVVEETLRMQIRPAPVN